MRKRRKEGIFWAAFETNFERKTSCTCPKMTNQLLTILVCFFTDKEIWKKVQQVRSIPEQIPIEWKNVAFFNDLFFVRVFVFVFSILRNRKLEGDQDSESARHLRRTRNAIFPLSKRTFSSKLASLSSIYQRNGISQFKD